MTLAKAMVRLYYRCYLWSSFTIIIYNP